MSQHFRFDRRSAGVLLHPTSLPGRHGCGDLGEHAYRFADFLASAGQHWWQMLPVGPCGYADSPYACLSAFAGNPLLIALDQLVQDGLLSREDAEPNEFFPQDKVDFGAMIPMRLGLLRKVFAAFKRERRQEREDFHQFCRENANWLEDYAIYGALKNFYRLEPWWTWDRAVRLHEATAIADARRKLADDILYERVLQFLFARQWNALKTYCTERGVGLIGDIPIFVALDSCDVWSHREMFQMDAEGRPIVVSGVPPDMFSATGQLWGHPLYEWEHHSRSGFAWWVERFRYTFAQFDSVRIDHFLGFNRCWAVPNGSPTAERGEWQRSPGHELFAELQRQLGPVQIIAEDLGLLIPEAAALRDRFGFPGMRIMQFGFANDDVPRYHQPQNFTPASVVYTGTHDNDTSLGWFEKLSEPELLEQRGPDGFNERERVLRYLHSDGRHPARDMIRAAFGSVANTAIAPMQDWLELDTSARMNIPSTIGGNWQWRMLPRSTGEELAGRMREMTVLYQRLVPVAGHS